MQRDRSTSSKRTTSGAGKLRAASWGRRGTTPASPKVKADAAARSPRGGARINACEQQNDDQVFCPQARATMLAYGEWVRMLERNAYLRRLFPGEIAPYEQDQVLARIRRHFPEISREDIDKMDAAEMVVYLKQMWEAEQCEQGSCPQQL